MATKPKKQPVQTDDVLMPWERPGAEGQSEETAEKSLFELLGSDPEFADDDEGGDEEPENEDGLTSDAEADEESEDEDEDLEVDSEADDEFEDEDDDLEEDEDGEDEEDDELHIVKVDGQDLEVSYDELINGYSRTEYLTRTRQKEAAEHRAAMEEVRAHRTQYVDKLAEVTQVLEGLTGEPDWERIQKERPQDYPRLLGEWQKRQKATEALKAEQEKEAKALQDEAIKTQQERVDQEFELLQQAVPEWKDPAKMKEGIGELASFAISQLGFTQDELNSVYDHRILLMLRMAQKAHKLESKGERKLKSAKRKTKRVRAGGRKRKSSGKPKRSKTHQKRAERVARSGSVHDAARLFDGMLEDGLL